MKKIKFSILVIASILVGVFLGAKVNAETVLQSMTVSPPNQRLILMPGESYEGVIKVSNANASIRDLKYSVVVGSFSQVKTEDSEDDYGVVDHVSVSNYNQIMDWISFDKEEGVVAPNTTDTIIYTIDVPKNAPAGGQYATIIVRDETGNGDSEDNNVTIGSTYQFAVVIFADITGETREIGSIESNSIPTIAFGGPLSVSSMVRNDGNVHTDAKYTLQVWPLFSDAEIYSNEEEPATSLVLPETERYNVQTWDDAPMVGIFKVRQTVEIFGDVSTVEKVVIICPLWLIVVIILVATVIIIWLITRNKNRNKN